MGFRSPRPATGSGYRVRLLTEAIEVFKLLLTQDKVSFEGRFVKLDSASYRPRPVQQPYPPIWIGASGQRSMLPLAGRVAAAWHSFGNPDTLARRWEIVRASAEKAGRDPSEITRATNLSISEGWDEVRRVAKGYRDAGLDYLIVSWPSEGRGRVEEFVAKIAPDLA